MTLQEKADKLLKKKKITGHDVGALLLDSFRVNIVPGEKQIKAEDFAELENRLQSETDRAVYLMFRNIYFPLISLHEKTVTQTDAFIQRMNADRLLKEFINNEEVQAKTNTIPVIIEEKEYKKLIAAAKAVTKSNPATAYYFVLAYIRLWEDKTPNTKIKNAVRKYKKMSPVLNKLRSESGLLYNSFLLKPKYKLNGKEIDSIQDPAFIEAKKARALELTGNDDLKAYDEYITDKKMELLYKGPAAIRDYMEAVSGTRLSSIDDNELMKLLEVSIGADKETEYLALDYINMENALRLYPVIEYCGTEEDKYQEGRSSFDMLYLYTAGPISDDLPEMIRKDFPILDAAIVDYLNDEMENDFPTLPDFYVASISGCYKDHPEILERINEAGLAVNRKPYPKQKGKYIFPQIDFYRAGEKEEKSLKIFEPLAYMDCYNTLIELLAEVFDVPELLEFAKIDIPDWNTYRDTFNSALFSTYYNLGQYYSGDKAKMNSKRDTLKGLFPYDYMRSVSDFLPNKKVVEEVKKDLTALRDSKDPAGKLRMLEYFYITPLLDSVKL